MESFRVVTSDLVTPAQSVALSGNRTAVDYQAHVGPSIEQFYDRIKRVVACKANGRINKSLIGVQLRHRVLTLRQLLIARFELLCSSIQLENHVRYTFNELCSLLDLTRDKVNKIIEEIYGETLNGQTIQHTELLSILLERRSIIVVNKISNDTSAIEKTARQESYLLRTFCAALLTLLPPPSWGNSVTSYILREGLDSLDDSDWTNFLMPGINSQIFREYVTMTTSRFWKAVSQDLVAMDYVSCGGVSATNIHHIATSEGLEAYTSLSYTLLYTGVQLQRHEANRDQDFVTCNISTLLLTDKCLQHGSHGNTLMAHTIVNDLLQSYYSLLGVWLQPCSHTHFTCLQANALQVKLHLLRGVANVLQDCSQWYQCRLHQYISNWQLQPFVLLLMGDLPLLLNFMQQQLLPLISSQLVGVAGQLQVLVDDVKKEHEKLTRQFTMIREHLSNFLKCFHDNLVKRYQQLWAQPIKLTECAPTGIIKESVEHVLLPCVNACAALPPTTQETCVAFCVTVTIHCWRNCLVHNSQRYSKQHFCQLLSDYTYMVSSGSHDASGLTPATRNHVNHLPVVMETREALYKLCGIYYNNYDGSHDPVSHNPIISEILSTLLPKDMATDQWTATMAAKKK